MRERKGDGEDRRWDGALEEGDIEGAVRKARREGEVRKDGGEQREGGDKEGAARRARREREVRREGVEERGRCWGASEKGGGVEVQRGRDEGRGEVLRERESVQQGDGGKEEARAAGSIGVGGASRSSREVNNTALNVAHPLPVRAGTNGRH